jgi:hypothetical protein
MKSKLKNDSEYQKARANLITLLESDDTRNKWDNKIRNYLERYEKLHRTKDDSYDVLLFKNYFRIDSNKEYSMLQLGLEFGFDASTVSRRVDKIIDYIIMYDIIIEENIKLLFDIFGEPYEEPPKRYRFLNIADYNFQ